MIFVQDKIVSTCHIISESSWIFVLITMIATPLVWIDRPVSWLEVVLVLGTALAVHHIMGRFPRRNIAISAMPILFGVAIIYLVVSLTLSSERGYVVLNWPSEMFYGEPDKTYVYRGVTAMVISFFLWIRGGNIASADLPRESVSNSFKLGILALAIASVAEAIHPMNFDMYAYVMIFFLASIIGLIVGHLHKSAISSSNSTWILLIGLIGGGVVLAGLLFKLLSKDALGAIALPVIMLFNFLSTVILYGIILPVIYVVSWLLKPIGSLLGLFIGPTEWSASAGGRGAVIDSIKQSEDTYLVVEQIVQVLQTGSVVIILIICAVLAYRSFRRKSSPSDNLSSGVRNSIRENTNTAKDLANLLSELFARPSRVKRFALPSDKDPRISKIFDIYFKMLLIAESRGARRPSSITPLEFQEIMRRFFSSALVESATKAFTRACYGHHPTSEDKLRRMEAELNDEDKRHSDN